VTKVHIGSSFSYFKP